MPERARPATRATAPWPPTDEPVVVDYRLAGVERGRLAEPVEVAATGAELDAFLADGYLERPRLFSADEVAAFADAVDRLVDEELAIEGVRPIPGNGYYVADVLAKDRVFHRLVTFDPLLSIARALLGPQVSVRTEARVAFEGTPDVALEWHIHMPVVPDPMPPLFSYPHQVHCLIYLDDITEAEGRLQLVPGSHRDATLRRRDLAERSDVRHLRPAAGDCVILHGNLWHRTEPSSATAGRRRLLIHGYGPAWLRSDRAPAPGQLEADPGRGLVAELRRGADEELDELLEGFHW